MIQSSPCMTNRGSDELSVMIFINGDTGDYCHTHRWAGISKYVPTPVQHGLNVTVYGYIEG